MVSSLTLNVGDFTLATGDTRQLTANIIPSIATNPNLLWTSSNTNVATVSPTGLVTAVAEGTATITVAARDDSNKSASLTVTVRTPVTFTTPAEIFEAFRGMKATTNGWADAANNGAGITYTNPDSFILIDDSLFPNPIAKLDAFRNALNRTEPTFIIISGDIDLSRGRISFDSNPPESVPNNQRSFRLNSNTVLIGINDARLLFGGLNISGGSNIIVKNITIWDPLDENNTGSGGYGFDAFNINSGATGIWINHVRFTGGTRLLLPSNPRYHDDTLNIRGGQVTVSWCEFDNLGRVLLAGSNAGEIDRAQRRITLHHNYFHDVEQRVPRTRGTYMHIYNNYYAPNRPEGVMNNGMAALAPGRNAAFVVQNNLFDTRARRGVVDYQGSTEDNNGLPNLPAIVWSSGNVAGPGVGLLPNGVTNGEVNWGTNTGKTKPWEPANFYQFNLSADVEGLRTLLPAKAGPTLFF
jgi:pectate lyase